ncbi:MAG: hypothetical protein C0478_09570 [Planctomyces sp.]|nr:hypothetical protein [Planctomyces sp.]
MVAVRVRLPEAGLVNGVRGKLEEGVAGFGVVMMRSSDMGGAFGSGVSERMGEKGLGMGLVGGGWGRGL